MTTRNKNGRPRTEQLDPTKAVDALVVAAATGSIRAASRATGLSRRTVHDILERNPGDFQTVKTELARKTATLADAALEQAAERMKELSPQGTVIAAGVLVDKTLALLGTAPGQGPRIQINALVADLNHTIQALRAAARERRASKPVEN